tara:strand:- start:1245 stop:1409 length:165 start_codon:yes stop_codon:yes gene_type:complete
MKICFYMYADGICGRFEEFHKNTTHVHEFTSEVDMVLTASLLDQVAPEEPSNAR